MHDVFTYTISDGNGGTDTASITVTVTGVNDAPTQLVELLLLMKMTAHYISAMTLTSQIQMIVEV